MSSRRTISNTFTVTTMDDPVSVQAQYAPNNTPTSGQIHTTWQAGDLYMRTRESDESAWSSWHKIVGESGDETDYTFNISKSLTSTNATTAPANCYYNTWQDAPIAPTSTYPYLWMKIVKKTWNESTQSYDSGTARYARMTGEPGTSPYFADLNNEMDAIQCNHDGGVITSQTVSTVISMWKGSAVEAFVIDNIYRNGTQLTWGSTSNGVKASKSGSTVSIEFGTNASIADIDDFKITIHSYNDNTVTRELHFTINGVRANAIYRLVPSHSQIVKKKDGTYEPSVNITCSVEKTENGSTSTPSSSEYTLEKSVNGGSYTTYSATAPSSITSDLKFRLKVGGVVVDLETIPLVSDGDKGNEGKGYKAVVTRNNFTESNWATYGESGHSETWGNTSSTRGNCKTGDWFIVVGTATDTKNYHIATYECSNDSGNLAGTCINHQKTKDGVSYCFVFTKAAARVDENNIVTAELAGYAYKYVGGVRSALTSTTIRYGYISTDSDTYVDTTTNSSGFFDAGTWFNGDDITDYGKNSPSIFAAIVIGDTVVHAEMITISVKGSTGGRGKVGRFFYYAGEWDDFASTDSFLVNDAQAPYFYYNNNYWVFNPETNGTYTKQNMGTPSSSSSNWKLMTNDFKYIITEAIFGSYAHLGSSIINGDYMMSQYVIAVGFDNTKQSVDDSTKYIYIEPNDVFAEDSLDDYNEHATYFPLVWTPSSSDDYLSVDVYSYSNSACISFNRQMNWGGCMYTCQIEYWSSGSSLDWKIGEQPSSGTVINQGQLPEYYYDDVTYNTNTFFITLVTPSASSSLKMFFKLSSTEGSAAEIKSIIIRQVKFTPTNCLDMLVGKIVANNIIARGQLYAESFFFETLNGGGNNNVLVVNRESIITLSKNSQGSTVILPTPTQDMVGRVIEIFCGQDYRDQSSNSPSWFLSFRGMQATSTSDDENRFISPLKTGGTIWGRFSWTGGTPWQTYARTTDLGHITYVKMVCVYGGNNKYYWSVIKAEETYVVNLTPRGSSSAMPLSVTTNWFVNDSAV